MSVPTPTGVLQGVAAFNWDGAVWQPAGRAGPSVATPTGTLQGVAAFTGGPSWAPSGRSGPGVPTPTGVLDGVAVYTWSGSQWTPSGGTETVPTPTGGLRGVAAFDWDGTVWQPAAQARSSVPTPYGVLDGVARFGWTGSAWVAVGAPSLSLDFRRPGALDPRITYTRAGPATYTDSAGTIQTAAINTPRWDYDPITHVLCGLLIEEARTNIWLQSADASNAAWSKSPGIAPTVTGNQAIAPDGTLSAARVAMPAVSGAGSFCNIYQNFTTAVAAYSLSVWLRGTVGGERLWLSTTPDGVLYYRTAVTLTTAWQRVSLTTPNLTAVPWFFGIGVDLRDAGETAQGAQTFHVWGGQVELGGFVTSYIPTTSAPVVRAQDQCGILSASMSPWFTTAGTWMAEWIFIDPAPTGRRILGAATASGTGSVAPLTAGNAPFPLGSWDGVSYFETTNNTTSNVVQKGANASSGAVQPVKLCLNGGPIANLASSTNGFASLATTGVRFLQNVAGVSTDNGNGYIRRVQFWPRVLTNTEMQTVTT